MSYAFRLLALLFWGNTLGVLAQNPTPACQDTVLLGHYRAPGGNTQIQIQQLFFDSSGALAGGGRLASGQGLLARWSPSAELLWAKQLPGLELREMVLCPDKNWLVLLSGAEVVLAKCTADGLMLWSQQLPLAGYLPNAPGQQRMTVFPNGDIGLLIPVNAQGTFVLRFDPGGTLLWQRFLPGVSEASADAARDGSNSLWIFAAPRLLLQLSADGQQVLRQQEVLLQPVSSLQQAAIRGGHCHSDGSFSIWANVVDNAVAPVKTGLALYHCDAAGNLRWTRSYAMPGTGIEQASIRYFPGKGWLLAAAAAQQHILFRLKEDGDLRWARRFDDGQAAASGSGFFDIAESPEGRVAGACNAPDQQQFYLLLTDHQANSNCQLSVTDVPAYQTPAFNLQPRIIPVQPAGLAPVPIALAWADVLPEHTGAGCLAILPCPELCSNGIDDDNDGYLDCYDADCDCLDNPNCSIKIPPNTDLSIKLGWRSPSGQSLNPNTLLVGNLNPQTDSIPEIISSTSLISTYVKLVIYRGDGQNKEHPDSLKLTKGAAFNNYPVIGDVDGDGIPEIVAIEADRIIRVYRHYTPGAKPPMDLWIKADKPVRLNGFRPMLADMDGDGTPEVVAGDEVFIFDFTGVPLLRKVLDANSYHGKSVKNQSSSILTTVSVADLLSPADCGGDPDCQGLEIAAGPVIYSIDLDTLDGDGFQIKEARNLNLMAGPDQWSDGYTTIADMDIDGVPDVVTMGYKNLGAGPLEESGVYVWNKNGLRKFLPRPPGNVYNDHQLPAIGNVFDDRKLGLSKDFPEIILNSSGLMICYNLHATAVPAYSAWWFMNLNTIPGVDGSVCSLFDFNGDEFFEILCNDLTTLRILYGGPWPLPPGVDAQRNWVTIAANVGAGHDVAPVVADVDNDGQAEILYSPEVDTFFNGFADAEYPIHVYESANIPWPACRPVWNQYNYNIVSIEDDLRVPKQPQQQWKELPGPGSGKRPLNMHLGQVPLLDASGHPLILLADLVAQADSVSCDKDSLLVQLRVCNTGSAGAQPKLALQWYLDNPGTTAAQPFLPPMFLPDALAKNACRVWEIRLPLPPSGTLFGIINDNGSVAGPIDLGSDFPSTTQLECNYTNNLFSINIDFQSPVLDIGPDRSVCPNTTSLLEAAAGFTHYQWQDGSAGHTFLAPGPGHFWVDAWDLCGNKFTDTVLISAIPTSTLDLGPDPSLCAGESLTFDLSSFDQVNWQSTALLNCTTCPVLNLTPDASLGLQVTALSGGCTLHDSINLILLPVPQISAQTSPSTCGQANGSISLLLSGGQAPYSILWAGAQSGTALTSLPAGHYAVTVTSAQACSTQAGFDIAASAGPLLSDTLITPVRCFGENNGQIEVQLSGGTPPYQYNWPSGPGNPVLNNLPAGNYALTATDAAGCSTTAQLIVSQAALLEISAIVDSSSCLRNTADIVAQGQGGTAPYSFDWGSGQHSPVQQGLAPGIYTLFLNDAAGCTAERTFVVAPGGSPALSDTLLVSVRCFGENNGQISIVVAGGVLPYQYAWSQGTGTTQLNALAAGLYSVSVTDANGCSTSASFLLQEPAALAIDAGIDSTSCTRPTADIALQGAGGTAPYLFAWAHGPQTATLSQALPGTYTVSITDAKGCSATETIVVGSGQVLLTDTFVQPVSCFGEANATIGVSVQNGAAPYQFNWSAGAGNNVLEQLSAGAYSLTVVDAKGCTATAEFMVQQPDPLILTANIDSTNCTRTTADIALAGQGGVAPLVFAWSTGAGTSAQYNLPPGNYTVSLSDANGCLSTQVFVVDTGGSPVLLESQITPVRCLGEANAQIAVSLSGGTLPYLYEWSAPGTDALLDSLSAGDYKLTATDAKGCSTTAVFSVHQPPALELQAVVDSTSCTQATASIAAQGQGGTAPYAYAWSTGQNTAALSGLLPGLYTLSLSDAQGCTREQTFDIAAGGAPLITNSLLTPVRCFGENNGQIEVNLDGGVPPYQFNWSSGPGTSLLSALSAGEYSLTATGANGCMTVASFSIVQPEHLSLMASVDSTSCTQATAAISLQADGGTAPYVFAWNTGQNTAALTGLPAGVYTVGVSDAKGCTTAQTFVVAPGGSPALSNSLVVPVRCFGEKNGRIEVQVQGGTAPYQFDWSTGAGSALLDMLGAGTYSLTLSDAQGCSATAQFELTGPDSLSADFTIVADTCARFTGAVATSTEGGTAPYQFMWPDGQTAANLGQLAAGTLVLTLTDAQGCMAVLPVEVPALSIFPQFEIAGDTLSCRQPAVLVAPHPAPPDWIFTWQTPGGLALNGPQQLLDVAGAYQLMATNSLGCSTEQLFLLPIDTVAPSAVAAANDILLACDQSFALLDGSSSSSGNTITAEWYREASGQILWDTLARVAQTADAGIFVLRVSNQRNGCQAFDTVRVTLAERINGIFITADSVRCFGYSDGALHIEQVIGGTAPYEYNIDNQNFTTKSSFEKLPAGNYLVQVRDAAGCTWEEQVLLGQPAPLSVNLAATDTLVDLGDSIGLVATVLPPGAGLSSIQWWPPGWFSSLTSLTQTLFPAESALVRIRVEQPGGCAAEASVQIRVRREGLYLPNAINPDSPSNGSFTVYAGADVEQVQMLRIFDRWGELLFERFGFPPNDPSQGWDGRFRGQAVGPGVYAFHVVVVLKNGRSVELSGDVTVLY